MSRATPSLTLHEKLKELAYRVEGEDAETVWAAVMATAPGPVPTTETLSEPMPGLYYHFRLYK